MENIEIKHTLGEFIGYYNPKYIQLKCGVHLINIDTDAEGSWFIVRNFKNENFKEVSYTNNLLILES